MDLPLAVSVRCLTWGRRLDRSERRANNWIRTEWANDCNSARLKTINGDYMATIKVKDWVAHKNSRETFGIGIVEAIDKTSNTVVVLWLRHQVTRQTANLSKSH